MIFYHFWTQILTWPNFLRSADCRETLLSHYSMNYSCGSRDIYILWPLGAAFLETCWWQSVYWLPVNHWYFNIYLYREFFSFPGIIFFYFDKEDNILWSKTTCIFGKYVKYKIVYILNFEVSVVSDKFYFRVKL